MDMVFDVLLMLLSLQRLKFDLFEFFRTKLLLTILNMECINEREY